MTKAFDWYEIIGWIRLEKPLHYVSRVISIGTEVRDIEPIIEAEYELMKQDWPNIKEFDYRKA